MSRGNGACCARAVVGHCGTGQVEESQQGEHTPIEEWVLQSLSNRIKRTVGRPVTPPILRHFWSLLTSTAPRHHQSKALGCMF